MANEDELTSIPHQLLNEAEETGIQVEEKKRSGTFFHLDQSTITAKVNEQFQDKIELMDTKNALKKYPWLEKCSWNLVDKSKDEFTKKVAEEYSGGYFIRILSGAEVTFPLQSCLMITQKNLEQRVHNIIIYTELHYDSSMERKYAGSST